MKPSDLLTELHSRGVTVSLNGERLHVDAPAGTLTPDLRAALVAHKSALLTLLRVEALKAAAGPEVRWRLQAMQEQLTPGQPAMLLFARPDLQPEDGQCVSCGEPLPDPEPQPEGGPTLAPRLRCDLCAHAAALALEREPKTPTAAPVETADTGEG
jgi:tubulysin polyketide synthase-like protein